MDSYRENNSINYSLLKNIATDPKQVIAKYDISDKNGVKRGDLLDLMFSDPDSFGNKYTYFNGEVPTATTLELANRTVTYVIENNIQSIDNKLVLEIVRANKYYPDNWKDDTIIGKFDTPLFWDYVNFQIKLGDKLMIEKELYDEIEQAYQTILTHQHTAHIFDEEKRELIYQNPIYTELSVDGTSYGVKALPDVISIDHKNKIIYPYDFKMLTGYTAYGFKSRFLDMKYYIQSALYTFCIRQWAKEKYKGYNVVNYKFIVISNKNLKLPLIYDPYKFVQTGFTGFDEDGKSYPGIHQLIKDLMWHRANNKWQYRRELYETNGEIKL